MTELPQHPAKIIVVAEQPVYDLLYTSGVSWDVQHRVESVGQMWDDLSGGRLDQQSVAIVFSDNAYAGPEELEAAIAAMAPYAATFLVAWNAENVPHLLATVRKTAVASGSNPDAPVHVLYPTSKQGLLDGLRNVFAASPVPTGYLPVTFPDQYPVDVTGPVEVAAVEEPVWEPTPVTEPVAPQPVTPVAQPVYADPVPQPVAPQPVYADPVPQPVAPQPVYTQPQPVAQPVAPQPVYTQPQPVAQPQYDAVMDQAITGEKPILPGQVTMAVTSSKGGSGKSTTAMMLAAQIAHSSRKAYEAGLIERPLKVCLVDMDTRDGQVASLIGCYVPTALNIRVSPEWNEETILANLVHDPKLGIDALLAPVRPRTADDVGPEFYRQVIRVLKTTHDVVIMDTSVNYLDPLISTVCLPEATAILFVTTLATTSVQGMARALREITEPAEHGGMGIKRTKIGIVVNQSITEVGMDRDQVIQAALKVSIVGAIPLATKDVLTCTNYNRMHQLLKHPLLGPAYFKLAKTCLPNQPLVPVLAAAPGTPAAGAATGAAPVAPVAPEEAAGAHVHNQSADAKKRGLFGKRG